MNYVGGSWVCGLVCWYVVLVSGRSLCWGFLVLVWGFQPSPGRTRCVAPGRRSSLCWGKLLVLGFPTPPPHCPLLWTLDMVSPGDVPGPNCDTICHFRLIGVTILVIPHFPGLLPHFPT